MPAEPEAGRFASAVLIDRAVDVVTPLCTQLMYSGLIDEMFGFNAG